jgi:opacity protein-like surface antigen
MSRLLFALCSVILLAALGSSPAQAQGVHVSPLFGAFHPSSNLTDLRDAGLNGELARDNALALGLNVEFGSLRLSGVYATGAKVSERPSRQELGDGSLLAVTGNYAFRPIPRIAGIQPYGLAGAGFKRDSYSFNQDGFPAIDDTDTNFAWHLGLGADLMLGSIGIVAEVSDFITSTSGERFGRHDTFALLGLRIPVF